MRIAIFAMMSLLTGCATSFGAPYGKIGIGWQDKDRTDWWLQTDRPDQCDRNPLGYFGAGWDFTRSLSLEYEHQSWVFCGFPFNHHPEITQQNLRLSWKFGGLK